MLIKVDDTTKQTGLDWQIEEAWADIHHKDNHQSDTQNSQVNDSSILQP